MAVAVPMESMALPRVMVMVSGAASGGFGRGIFENWRRVVWITPGGRKLS